VTGPRVGDVAFDPPTVNLAGVNRRSSQRARAGVLASNDDLVLIKALDGKVGFDTAGPMSGARTAGNLQSPPQPLVSHSESLAGVDCDRVGVHENARPKRIPLIPSIRNGGVLP